MERPFISIVPAELPPREAYQLLISAVVPRPIAWVSSIGADGTLNLAPFSFFNAVGGNPPTVMVAIGQRDGRPKDTLRNVQETGEFVVNIVDEPSAQVMTATSGEFPYEVDEFEFAGLQTAASTDVRPPRVATAAVALEVKLNQVVPVNGTRYTMIIGRVLRFHIRPDLLRQNGLIDAEKLRPIGRLGGDEYTTIGTIFHMKR